VSNIFKAITVVVRVIGLYEIISIIIGVPAIILLVINIWHSLTNSQQIVAIIVSVIILAAIGLFIYSQIRKRLYRIPKVLHQMYKRMLELASELDATALSQEDFADLMSLINIDASQLYSSITDLESLAAFAPELIKAVETQVEKVAKDEEKTGQRTFYLMYDKVGLKRALEADRQYQKLKQSLNKLMPVIPTVEINRAVLEYEKSSRIVCTFLPIFSCTSEQVQQALPLQYKIDETLIVEQSNEKMALLLSKVWEAIDKYYKGN